MKLRARSKRGGGSAEVVVRTKDGILSHLASAARSEHPHKRAAWCYYVMFFFTGNCGIFWNWLNPKVL